MLCQCLIQLHQQRDAGAFAGKGRIALFNAIGGHDGEVVLLVRLAQLGGHGALVIEIGEAGVRIQCPGVQYSPSVTGWKLEHKFTGHSAIRLWMAVFIWRYENGIVMISGGKMISLQSVSVIV